MLPCTDRPDVQSSRRAPIQTACVCVKNIEALSGPRAEVCWLSSALRIINVTSGQMARLIELAGRPNITLEIVPFSAGFHRGMLEPLHILEFPDHEDSDVLFSESSRDMILSRDESGEIAGYRVVFEHLRDASLGEVGTLAYLRNLARQIQN